MCRGREEGEGVTYTSPLGDRCNVDRCTTPHCANVASGSNTRLSAGHPRHTTRSETNVTAAAVRSHKHELSGA